MIDFGWFSTPPWDVELPRRTVLRAFLLMLGTLLLLPNAALLICRYFTPEERTLSALIAQGTLVIVLALGVTAGRAGAAGSPAACLGLRRWRAADVALLILAFAAMAPLIGAVTALWDAALTAFGFEFEQTQPLLLLTRRMNLVELAAMGVLVTLIVPMAEELLFRRYLYGLLLPCGAFTAFFGTAALFSLAHLFLRGAPGLLILGAAFQFVYLKSRNLWVAVALHAAVNAAAMLRAVLENTGL